MDDSEVVGRGDDVLKMVNLLIGANNQRVISVIPIVGMAGLGKTTIAQLVYNDKRVKKHFDEKIWVCVSESFDVKRILREILEALDHNCSGLSIDALTETFSKHPYLFSRPPFHHALPYYFLWSIYSTQHRFLRL